jgi:hypothetical protein
MAVTPRSAPASMRAATSPLCICWRWIESANRTANLIAERQFRTSAHGRALMTALLERTEAHFDLPGLRSAPAFLVRYLLGDRTAQILGIPAQPAGPTRFPGLVRSSVQKLALHGSPLFGRRLLERVISVKLGGEQVRFAMPTRLAAD